VEKGNNRLGDDFSRLLTEDLLEQVVRPGQYLGNEWGTYRKPWDSAAVHLALAFPDLYELGMSNFGQRILYQIVNSHRQFLADRTYAPDSDMEALIRKRGLPLWGWESRQPLNRFELIGFSLQYELTYTNLLNMLELAQVPVIAAERKEIFPLVFGGGPSAVNPEPMALFLDFLVIGDGEEALPAIMELVRNFQTRVPAGDPEKHRQSLLVELATRVPGVYVPSLYHAPAGQVVVEPIKIPVSSQESHLQLPVRINRQICPLSDLNQPTAGLVPYLNLVHDRQVLEVRRGCDRGCRFCQPGYTFLPVRERSTDDLLRLSKEALDKSGHQEYSLLSLCVSDYTSLHETVRALNREHMSRRASMSFPSQRADRMNLDIAEELKVVRKSGITLAPEAGSERLRAVINKGLNHQQIISAIEAAYRSGWTAVKLYFMLGLPTEEDEDLAGIIEILKEATERCRQIRRSSPEQHRRGIEFTCTLSNFVPKPFTPFQWYGQISLAETERRQRLLKDKLKESGLRNVTLNFTKPEISLLEAVISRGDRSIGQLIYRAWKMGATFDAWDERFRPEIWHKSADAAGLSLTELASSQRQIGSRQPWDIVHVGLHDWWLVKEWEKAIATQETAPCTENTCHACGVCTELDKTHLLASAKPEVIKKNPFVKELAAHQDPDAHPSLFFQAPSQPPPNQVKSRIRFQFTKTGELRFISHLDLQHLLARAARRAGIQLAFTEGFNPSPRLSLAASLPLFQEALAEVGEVELAEAVEPELFVERLNRQLPPEVKLIRARAVATGSQSLASLVGRAAYRAELVLPRSSGELAGHEKFVPDPDRKLAESLPLSRQPLSRIKEKIVELLAQPTIEIPPSDQTLERQARRSRTGTRSEPTSRDIRSGIYSVTVGQETALALKLELAAGPRMHVRPADVLRLLEPAANWRVTRLYLATPEGVPLFDIP